MKKRLAPLILAIPLFLAGCSAGWSEEEKLATWDRYQCQGFSDIDAKFKATQISIDVFHGDYPNPIEAQTANNVSRELQKEDTVGGITDPDGDLTCETWLWEQHQNDPDYMDGYEEFTEEQAETAGVLEP